jgi:hypothetical protein
MMTPQPPRSPSEPKPPEETDPRFPSGPWRGFFLMSHWPGRHQMELLLSFRQGVMTGEGRDMIGSFLIRGKYNLDDGKCHWTKRYIGKHDVAYQGFNEGKGIWGLWEIPPSSRGGFHIWPEAMGDPTSPHLAEAADLPVEEIAPEVEVEVGAGVGVGAAEPVGAPMDFMPDMAATWFIGDPIKGVAATFRQLAETWKAQTALLSSVRQKKHPAYRQIIQLGEQAVPLILEDLKRKPSHLFWALAEITGASPAGLADAKDLLDVVNSWIEWGRTQGYVVR